MKKLFVNEEACIGCGACVAIDSKHFDFNEDGLSEVINNEEIDTDECRNAIASCPTNAISYVVEEETQENEKCTCEHCNCEDCECTEDECNCEGCDKVTECENENCHCENCTCVDCKCNEEGCHCEGCNENNCNCEDTCDCKEECHCNHLEKEEE